MLSLALYNYYHIVLSLKFQYIIIYYVLLHSVCCMSRERLDDLITLLSYTMSIYLHILYRNTEIATMLRYLVLMLYIVLCDDVQSGACSDAV